MISLLHATPAPAQGLSRSNGIGVRAAFWNMNDRNMRFAISADEQYGTVEISGVGGWLYFFSRVHQNWFLEVELGCVGNVRNKQLFLTSKSTDITAIVPFLFGLRYDLLSSRVPSTLQPYLAAGAGPYWISALTVSDGGTNETVVGESHFKYGAYTGGGMFIMLTSWAALNFDLRYHFVDYTMKNEYSGLQFGMGLSIMWGKKREIFQIDDIKLIVTDIYPVYYQFYNTYPLAYITIKNTAGYNIEINIHSSINGYSERVKETGFVRIERGKSKDIPVTAILSPRLLNVDRREPAALDLVIEARAGTIFKKQISQQVIIHHRNAWDGEIENLSLYVTPEEAGIIKLSRELTGKHADDVRDNLDLARLVFEGLREMRIGYQRDPNVPFYRDDRVQFAIETLELGSGDCDDLVVLYASLLESLGIHTAFIEVRDPEAELAHLYLLFDSGYSSDQALQVSSNEKRYVIREDPSGTKGIWIPVETTVIARGFEEAWKAGAAAYLQEAILRGGLAEKWIKIIDVNVF